MNGEVGSVLLAVIPLEIQQPEPPVLGLNLFQWVTLPVVFGLLLWELIDRRRRIASPGFWLVRCLVWVAAGVAIADPHVVQRVATAIGIGRGTDAVVYLFVLLFVIMSFYFYWQKVLLQRQITLLVRHIAIHEARQGQVNVPPNTDITDAIGGPS
jgi:small membrane protein